MAVGEEILVPDISRVDREGEGREEEVGRGGAGRRSEVEGRWMGGGMEELEVLYLGVQGGTGECVL